MGPGKVRKTNLLTILKIFFIEVTAVPTACVRKLSDLNMGLPRSFLAHTASLQLKSICGAHADLLPDYCWHSKIYMRDASNKYASRAYYISYRRRAAGEMRHHGVDNMWRRPMSKHHAPAPRNVTHGAPPVS